MKERVVYFAKFDLARGEELQKGERILRAETKPNYTDINDVLELYQLKRYIEDEVYLNTWTQTDIKDFKQKAVSYSKIVAKFMATIDKENFKTIYPSVIYDYVSSFWEIINNLNYVKNISCEGLLDILDEKPYLIREILQHKKLVIHFNSTLKGFFLSHPESAEILLSYYELEEDGNEKYYLPKSLTIEDKETIVNNYLDSPKANFNYLHVIQNARNRDGFKLSDRTRLKATRLYRTENVALCKINSIRAGISVSFPENAKDIKTGRIIDGYFVEYKYSLDFIKANNNPHALFENFVLLFEYLDHQRRIRLVNKGSAMDVIEKIIGLHSISEYRHGIGFGLSEMTSRVQIREYIKVLKTMGISLEKVLQQVFSSVFHQQYGFAENAFLYMPKCNSYFEKVRVVAPELESILKQYKLFVEDGRIDYELLQISSSPLSVKDIPSLNSCKYLYLNNKNHELSNIINIFFSNQTVLGHVEPYIKKRYSSLFDVLSHEEVAFDRYKDYQKPPLNYLINKKYLYVDSKGNIQFVNPYRACILFDLYQNDFGSFQRYTRPFRQEAKKMEAEGLVYFENTLFAKPEQEYYSFFLNKSEFTNGLDLRNRYTHGTQESHEDVKKHKYAYQTYLRLIVLALLKMEDDLALHKRLTNSHS